MKTSRLASITLAICLLPACVKQPDNEPAKEQIHVSELDTHAAESAQTTAVPVRSTAAAKSAPLNISLPDGYQADASPFAATEDDGKNVFNANAVPEESKLTFKPKVHIKEGTTFDSAVGGQGDAIEGAEFGIQYKTP